MDVMGSASTVEKAVMAEPVRSDAPSGGDSLAKPDNLTELDPAIFLRNEMEALVLKALKLKYTSYFSQERRATGNAYQSVKLPNTTTRGFRALRNSVLAGLPIARARVLDLGCNLGELSRLARSQGAALVDGFEFDPYFIQIGQAINAANGVTRVSFYQKDVTKPEIYQEEYDIVFSFSVITYTKTVLRQIAPICRRLFVLETHKIAPGWSKEYVDQVLPHFPYYCIVQRTDWGQALEDGARLLIVYARGQQEIASYITRRSLALGTNADELRHLDLRRSEPDFLARFLAWRAERKIEGLEIFEATVKRAVFDQPRFSLAPDYTHAASSAIYWIAYFAGYFQYALDGGVNDANSYVSYLRQACRDLDFDPFMSTLVANDEPALYERVRKRFEDTTRAIKGESLTPIEVINPMPESAPFGSALTDVETGMQVKYSHLDGYHRYASSFVAGHERLGYRMLWHPQSPHFRAFAVQAPDLEAQLFASLHDGLFPRRATT